MDTMGTLATIIGTVLVILGGIWKMSAWQSRVNSRLEELAEKVDCIIDRLEAAVPHAPPPSAGFWRSVFGLFLH